MTRFGKMMLGTVALAAGLMVVDASVLADSLVKSDGSVLTGKLAKTANGYAITTATGRVEVTAANVKQIKVDPAVAGVHGGHRAVDPSEMQALIDMGKTALAAGAFADARDAFKDAATLDPTNVVAARGLALAYLRLEKPQKAVDLLAMSAPKPVRGLDRTLTMAMASSLLAPGKSNNPMRAVSFLMMYLKDHSTQPMQEEPVINALAVALSKAPSSARLSTLFKDGANFYKEMNDKLEALRPGKRRWGVQWDDADAVAKKWKEHDEALKKANSASAALADANNKLNAATQALTNLTYGVGARNPASIAAAETGVSNATADRDKAQQAYNDANADLIQKSPNYGDEIAVDALDLNSGPLALASATPESVASAQPPTPVVTPSVPRENTPHENTPRENTPHRNTPVATNTPPPSNPVEHHEAAPEAPAKPVVIAKVTHSAVGFAVGPDLVVTAASAVDGASDVVVQRSDGTFFKADIVRTQSADGISLLKVTDANLPRLVLAKEAAPGKLSCLGYPEVNLFNPIPKVMPVSGREQGEGWSVSFDMHPRLPGAPLLLNGCVVGVELADRDSELGKIPAATLAAITGLLADPASSGVIAKDPKAAVVMVVAEK
jgi:tetratricopeptide (TPR) repeat protein